MSSKLLQAAIDACLDELVIARGAFIVDAQAKPKEFDAITERFWTAYQRMEPNKEAETQNLEHFRKRLTQEAAAFADLFDHAS